MSICRQLGNTIRAVSMSRFSETSGFALFPALAKIEPLLDWFYHKLPEIRAIGRIVPKTGGAP